MLNEAIGDLLPSALAVALSPIPIVAIVLVLAGPKARSTGPAFAVGWIGGLATVSVIVVLVLGTGNDPNGDEATGVGWLNVALGVLFLLVAARQWRKRPKRDQEPDEPSWMATVASATPGRALVLGATLSAANPKNLALTLAASASVAEAGLGRADTTIAIAVFIALGSATVVGSALFHFVAPRRAERPLAAVRQFMADNNAVIMTVVLLLIGVKLIGDGVGGL